ncbi:DNA circularization protein [Azonexus sp. R2A61]|uniref:DNA circularization protein n=1 Tax=Azonexus sp. R2A61 TaxID=2744443 RepID=UPI001F3B3AA8|nr:DNA circularization N-terminal domain-containing protein [Azonexus sp. R2A61]
MAWDKKLQDAAFRGVKFDIINVRDRKERALAEYEVPYVHGGVVDDLGWRLRRIPVTAVFFGVDYEERLQAFLKALDELGAGELIHPIFGTIKAQVVSVEMPHTAEQPDYCEVPVEFVETGDPAPFFAGATASQKADKARQAVASARGVSVNALTAGLKNLAGKIRGLKGQMAVLDQFSAVISGLKSGVNGVITAGLSVLTFPGAWLGDVRSLLSAIGDFGGRAMDRLDGSLAGWLGLRSRVAPAASGSAARPLPGIASEARALAEDAEIRERALALADSAVDILADEADDPRLTPAGIERVANDTRAAIQLAMDSARATYPLEQHRAITESLKDVAYQVQQAALAALVQRPPLVQRSAPFDGNLHLIAHAWYGDYTRAAELLRLNPQIRQPNFIRLGDPLYAYAR